MMQEVGDPLHQIQVAVVADADVSGTETLGQLPSLAAAPKAAHNKGDRNQTLLFFAQAKSPSCAR